MSEIWVDQQVTEMVPAAQWHTLNLNQLVETKNLLMNKIYMASGKQIYLKPLNAALAELDGMIAKKLADPRGSN